MHLAIKIRGGIGEGGIEGPIRPTSATHPANLAFRPISQYAPGYFSWRNLSSASLYSLSSLLVAAILIYGTAIRMRANSFKCSKTTQSNQR
jgi:hypothetical protein